MTFSDLWHRFAEAGPAAVVLVVATAGLLALPVFQRLVPGGRRHRGGPARLFLVVALLLALGAVGLGTMGASSPGNLLQLVGLLALMIGFVGVGGLVLFDLVLPRLRIDVPSIVRDLILLVVTVAVGMGFLRLAGLDLFSLVTTSAVLTAVIGLALQSTIANVLSGLSLQLDRTLRHGEWIEVGDHIGKILEIGWRSTHIQTNDGDTVFVPNSELVTREVRSFARPTGTHRITLRIGFHYRHPPNVVRRVLLAAVRDAPGVRSYPPADCGPVEFGDSAVIYALRYWIDDFARDSTIDEEVHARVWYAARRADLEIPYPTHTLLTQEAVADARAATAASEHEAAMRLLVATEPFAILDAESRRRCGQAARRLEFGRGEHLLRSDDGADDLYVIDSGAVSVRVRSNGTTTLHRGELVGRSVLPAYEACTAQSDVVVYALARRGLEDALTAEPRLGAGLSAIAAARDAALRSDAAPGAPATAAPRARALPGLQRLLRRR
jgi:small-conductance mechanosensitive channel/CRP-like cAMP-binding protein